MRVVSICAILLCLALCVASQRHGFADYFQALGLERGASDKDVKKAYRKLVRTLHPDAVAPEERERTAAKFREVTEAYEILSDPAKREQYESSGGRKPMTSGDDRQFLRNHLFNDFDGKQLNEGSMSALLDTNVRETATIVFFWSTNYPDCIDSAPGFKLLATRLRGTSVDVASFKCDDDPMSCRKLNLGNLPTIRMFPKSGAPEPFNGKIEIVALTKFAARFLRISTPIRQSSSHAILNTTPSPFPSVRRYGTGGNYLWATTKRSHLGELDFGLVTLEYGPCFDCETALQLALETVSPVMRKLEVRRVNCKRYSNAALCAPNREKDRAWTFAKITKRCWYATKKPFKFSDEHCEPTVTKTFKGKYTNDALVNFIVSSQGGSAAERFTPSVWVEAKKREDAWAVLFDTSNDLEESHRVQWSLLAKSIASKPLRNKKGFKLHVGFADCGKYSSMCDAYPKHRTPFALIFGFGTKVKQTEPIAYPKISGWMALRKDITRDADPLHLHMLGPKNYDKKINQGLKKGRTWFVLYNAGEWCPPCNQIRDPWKEATRIIMNSPTAKKLSMATVECDNNKKLCNSLGIQNYPTMSLISKGRPKVDFNGMRDGNEIAKWALEQLESRLVTMHPGELQQRINSGEPILVSFSAGKWCPPCTQINPVIKKVSNMLSSTTVTSVNCDEAGQFCNMFGIDGYPTVILFNRGRRFVFDSMKRDPKTISAWAKQFL